MVESSSKGYDDPVYAKFKNVLKGAEKVCWLIFYIFLG